MMWLTNLIDWLGMKPKPEPKLTTIVKAAPVPFKAGVTKGEIDKCLAIIAEGRYNHQYYVDHPSTDPEVGDAKHNQMWVDNYDLLKSVIERLNS